MTIMPWLLFSNKRIPAFEAAHNPLSASNTFHCYCVGWTNSEHAAIFDVDRGFSSSGRLASSLENNTISIEGSRLQVITSGRNVTPLYWACDRANSVFVIGTDLPTVTAAWLNLTDTKPNVHGLAEIQLNGNSCVENIGRLEHNCRLQVDLSSGELTIERIAGTDNLIAQSSRLCDAMEAGEAQIKALRLAIENRLGDGREVGVLVSGGVDSSLVAALIAEQTSEMTAFSIGTDFGDEFDDASQLTEALNKPLHKIMIGEEHILDALAPTIRAFGHADAEAVEIGVAITAFCRKAAGNRLIFTGYGSDLINSGLAVDSGVADDVRANIHKVVDKTRYSSELTNVAARAFGCDLAHPYWDPMVMRIALDTCPSVKTALGREKGHLRMAAQRLLPKEVAWRKKTAIHHGNGLAARLSGLIDSKTSRLSSANHVYVAMLIEQINDAISSPFAPMAPAVIFERAIHKISRSETLLALK